MLARSSSLLSILILAPQLAAAAPQLFAQNGHYYEFVSSPNICWDDAQAAAASMKFQQQTGHLATITTQAENDFIIAQFATGFASSAWIGGSDLAVEEEWRWVEGPESGLQFWQGDELGAPTAPFNYANWGSSEPNDFNGEDYAVIALGTLGATIQLGEWGDANLCGQNAFVGGYVVEYSGGIVVPTLSPWGLAFLATAMAALLLYFASRRRPLLQGR